MASGAIQNYFEHHSVYQIAYKASKISVAALLTYQTAINLARQLDVISKVLADVDRLGIITMTHFFLTTGALAFFTYQWGRWFG